MRDIKFRVWLKDEQKMVKGGCFMDVSQTPGVDRWVFGMDTFAHPDDLELMQYTGLKDKNGVEIYEGDIVKYHNRKDSYELHQIIYEEKAAAFLLFGANAASRHPVYVKYLGDIAKSNKSYDTRTYELCEVIGNIYENPELINSKEASTKGGER